MSLRWRLGVVRRRPKGTERSGREGTGTGTDCGQIPLPAQGLGGGTRVWMEGEAERPQGDSARAPLPALAPPASP